MVAIEMKKYSILQNRPTMVGFSVLDISKVIFYGFYYDFLKVHFSTSELKLAYCDTDGMILVVYDRDIYQFIKDYPEFFDTSKFSEKNIWGIQRQNANVSGVFKIETGDKIMTHFVGIRPKVYAYLLNRYEEFKLCKGVSKNVINKEMRFRQYVECLFENKTFVYDTKSIRAHKHEVYTINQRKKGLCMGDTKREELDDKINTQPWGYNGARNKER